MGNASLSLSLSSSTGLTEQQGDPYLVLVACYFQDTDVVTESYDIVPAHVDHQQTSE